MAAKHQPEQEHASRMIRSEGGPAWQNRGPCGYQGCSQQGLIAQLTVTGWLNLCEAHIGPWHRQNTAPKRRSDNAVMREIRAALKD